MLELIFLLMGVNKNKIAVRPPNNALLMFPLLKRKVLTGRGHLKFTCASSPIAWNIDSDLGGGQELSMNQQDPTP